MLPNNTFPGCIVDAHMCIEIAQKDKGLLMKLLFPMQPQLPPERLRTVILC